MLFQLSLLSAQDYQGIIFNEKGKPLKGITIWIKNTLVSFKTDKNGEFVLKNLRRNDTLIISVSKNKEAIILLKKRCKNFNVTLKKNDFIITEKSQESIFSYSNKIITEFNPNVLKSKQIEHLGANTFYDLFRGTLPGVTVSDVNGTSTISIRGGSSFDLNNEPLFIIDGVEYRSSSDADRSINISDIEQIEVKQDGAMYGIKGANGAILITTKKHN